MTTSDTRDALNLAALASAALPGLAPIRAEAVRGRAGERFQVGFVEDAEHRRWVVRVPMDAVAAAQQDASVTLLGMLARRVPFTVPSPKGFVGLKDGRRVMVYPLISGRALNLFALPGGPGLAAELGRAIAALHNVDRRLFEEAAMPVYVADDCRRRHQAEVDRGAQTGRVPVGLLSRWERMLDDVALWRFAVTPVHGRLDGQHVLAAFSSDDDAGSGRIRAIIGWEEAKVADPAEDFAALIATAAPDTIDTVLEAYAMNRLENPDPHLEDRARLIAELRLVGDLLAALSGKDKPGIAAATQALRHLNAQVGDPDAPAAAMVPVTGVELDFDAPAPAQLYRAGAPAAPAGSPVPDGADAPTVAEALASASPTAAEARASASPTAPAAAVAPLAPSSGTPEELGDRPDGEASEVPPRADEAAHRVEEPTAPLDPASTIELQQATNVPVTAAALDGADRGADRGADTKAEGTPPGGCTDPSRLTPRVGQVGRPAVQFDDDLDPGR